jgi:hypothetical protein
MNRGIELMTKYPVFGIATVLCITACGQAPAPEAAPKKIPPAATNAPAAPKSISVQEMLIIGHSGLKLHSLAMITQGKVEGGVDESFLPGFKVCADDSATPVRSGTARLLGQNFVQGKDTPHPEAVELLVKLAKDESSDVSYNAVYHGLTEIKNKSPEIVSLLIEVASENREHGLYDRIATSLEENRDQVIAVLDRQLAEGDNIAIFEIYEDLTGKAPANADKYLDMPSSRPRMFIFKAKAGDPNAAKSELEKALKTAGLTDQGVEISGTGENVLLMVKTYITKDYKIIEREFAANSDFELMQDMWLTPELEIQIDSMKKKM